MLSEVLRPQVQKEDLHAAEQRVSQALKNATALDTLPSVYLGMVAEAASSLRFRTVDGSDLSKPAGRAFEYLDVVRDGSCKPRDRVVVGPNGVQPSTPPNPAASPQARNGHKRAQRRNAASETAPPARHAGRPRAVARANARKDSKAERVKFPSPPALKKLGYWTVQIEAGNGTGDHLPLCQELFSTQDPAYQAFGEDAWTTTYRLAIERVLAHLGPEGIWLMDRGFDDIFWLRWMHANVEQSVIRLKSNRSVHPGTSQEKAVNISQLAESLDARHTTQIRYVDKSSHREKLRSIPFTWVPIWVKGVDHALYLIVAHTGRKRPLLLVTDCRPASPKEAGDLIQAYLERWGSEEVTRACKQLTGLERIRVRSFHAMRRLLWLAMIAVGIQSLMILTRPRLRRAILDRAKEFIPKVRFVVYRIWRVVQADLRHALEVRPRLVT
ncbi:MAG: transposase [Byssovorax sp.]